MYGNNPENKLRNQFATSKPASCRARLLSGILGNREQKRNDLQDLQSRFFFLAQDQVSIWTYPMKSLKDFPGLLEVRPLLIQKKNKLERT